VYSDKKTLRTAPPKQKEETKKPEENPGHTHQTQDRKDKTNVEQHNTRQKTKETAGPKGKEEGKTNR